MSINDDRLYQLIGEKIKTYRKSQGLTQADLAAKLGFERTSITNIESGKQHTPLHLLYRICVFLEIDIKDLMPNIPDVLKVRQMVVPSIRKREVEYSEKFSKQEETV